MPIFTASETPIAAGYRAPLATGDPGIAQTIAVIRQLIDQDLANPGFIRFARDLVRNVAAHDELAEVEAIYDWVSTHVRFVKDPFTKETLSAPSDLLKLRSGDCDDIAMLLAALYLAVGYPARLVTVSAQPESPDEFTHVYTEVEVPPMSGDWIAADAARAGAKFGSHPPMYFRRRAWSLVDDTYQDLAGATRMRGLGHIRRYRTLGADYPQWSGLGQGWQDLTDFQQSGGGSPWTGILQQSISEIPQIIGAVQGQPTISRIGGSLVQTGPYGSYVTPFTPGYGVPQAGYGYPTTAVSPLGANWTWVLIVLGAILLMRSGGGGGGGARK